MNYSYLPDYLICKMIPDKSIEKVMYYLINYGGRDKIIQVKLVNDFSIPSFNILQLMSFSTSILILYQP